MTAELQRRIVAPEQQLEQQKDATAEAKSATASTAEAADGEAIQKAPFGDSQNVGAQSQGQVPSRPTYDLLQELSSCRGALEWRRRAGREPDRRFRQGLRSWTC